MCFTKQQTLIYATSLFGISAYVSNSPHELIKHHRYLASYYALMELFQYMGYMVIENESLSHFNALVTFLPFIQICFQPAVTTWWLMRRDKHLAAHRRSVKGQKTKKALEEKRDAQDKIIVRYSLLGSTLDFLRARPDNYAHLATTLTTWFPGQVWATFQSPNHLGWSMPVVEQSYWFPGTMHFFNITAPFFIKGKWPNMISGVIFVVTGPLLAEYVVNFDMASAGSVWCFQSVVQVMMPFVMDCFEVYHPKKKILMWLTVLACLGVYAWNFYVIRNLNICRA